MILLIVISAVYTVVTLLLLIYGLNIFYMIFLSARARRKGETPVESLRDHPMVTVQLPVFNEKYVVERLVESVAGLNYPKEKLEIQLLDDSTDETIGLSGSLVEKYKKLGYDIVLLHRQVRTGHKGGALREALAVSKGEFVAIFDADFLPNPDFLVKTLPYFTDPSTGLVQTRWGHINPDYSAVTQAQAVAIDAHFVIEQPGRHASDYFMNFNGTAGIWRKSCILDSGNWQDDTLTEDLDLSYRAQLKGWKLRYTVDLVSPSELPVQINAFKSQQFRWAKGSIQTALKLFGKVLSSEKKPMVKFQAFIHLTFYVVHPLILLNILLSLPLLVLIGVYTESIFRSVGMLGVFFSITFFSPIIYCLTSQVLLYRDWPKKLSRVMSLVFLGPGLALNNSRAVLEALLGKKSPFIRTPKLGIEKAGDQWRNKSYNLPFPWMSVLELFIAIYSLAVIALSLQLGNYMAIVFYLLYGASFGAVFILGIAHSRKLRKAAA